MRTDRRFLSVGISVCLCLLSLLAVPCMAKKTPSDTSSTSDTSNDDADNPKTNPASDFEYTKADGVVTITGMKNWTSTEVVIPPMIDGLPVTVIGGQLMAVVGGEKDDITIGAFANRRELTSITIPDGVTTIGESAFVGCSGLKSITIPNGVTSIGDSAFAGCSGLKSITIPNGVTSIGSMAFGMCSGLESMEVSSENPRYQSIDGVLFTKDGKTIYGYPIGKKDGSYTIPDGVTTIEKYAFGMCSGLKSITIPDSVTTIGKSAFAGCDRLTSITIPDVVTIIGNSAFWGCSGLTSITIPDSVTSIGDLAFGMCDQLKSITIPSSVTSIGEGAFLRCRDLTIHAPRGSAAEAYAKEHYLLFETTAASSHR